jgi:hypothetical protein
VGPIDALLNEHLSEDLKDNAVVLWQQNKVSELTSVMITVSLVAVL